MVRIVLFFVTMITIGYLVYFFSQKPNLFRSYISPVQTVNKEKIVPPLPKQSESENLEVKVKSLEDKIASLESQLSQTGSPSETSSKTLVSSSSSAPQYIYALGTAAEVTSVNQWETISSLQITIDPSQFPGYKNMQLEAFIRLHQGNGKMFVRLYHQGTGLAIPESEISTSSENNIWLASSPFTLSEKKTYRFQLKSLTGYKAYLEDARVKVNF